jgi:hypothetical protein
MRRPKFDGVIEAVRYAPNGRITLARLYERRGTVWSDRILLDRKELTERLKQGKCFVTGHRELFRGCTFETGSPVHLNGENIVTKDRSAGRDNLTGIPIF